MAEISSAELKSMLESGEPVAVLDIREADEYAGWHIAGSRNVPVYDALRVKQVDALTAHAEHLPRDRPIVAVCRVGATSKLAASVLRDLGFDAVSLSGGMRAWGAVWSEATVDLHGGRLVQVRRNGKGCLSYLLASEGVAAVVDPSVSIEAYQALAEREGCRITHVLETHVHADHLSRARELSQAAGAKLVLPKNERVSYPYQPVIDGDQLNIGDLALEVVASPGHTGESMCYRVGDTTLLTGDTVFVDSIGRPDLERGDAGARSAAETLYRTLHETLLRRFSGTRIFPGHVGQPLGFDSQPVSAELGALREKVPLLEHDLGRFVDEVVASLQPKPPNFRRVIAVNEGKAELAGQDPLDLEAGPNRCAVG